MMKSQRAVPLGASRGGGVGPLAGIQLPDSTPCGPETERPGPPAPDGAPLGRGVGPEALGINPPQDDDMQRLVQYLPVFEHMAEQPNSSKAARNLVRQLKGML